MGWLLFEVVEITNWGARMPQNRFGWRWLLFEELWTPSLFLGIKIVFETTEKRLFIVLIIFLNYRTLVLSFFCHWRNCQFTFLKSDNCSSLSAPLPPLTSTVWSKWTLVRPRLQKRESLFLFYRGITNYMKKTIKAKNHLLCKT